MANLNINRVLFGGRIVNIPETKQTPSGSLACEFRIAVNRGKSKTGEQITDFIPVIAWADKADFITRYFTKGSSIVVAGQLNTRQYEKNGEKRYAFEISVERAYFVDSKAESMDVHTEAAMDAARSAQEHRTPQEACAPTQNAQYSQFDTSVEDELPF